MPEIQDAVRCEVHGGVGVLTIARPKTLNALDVPTLHALEAGLTRLEQDAVRNREAIGILGFQVAFLEDAAMLGREQPIRGLRDERELHLSQAAAGKMRCCRE